MSSSKESVFVSNTEEGIQRVKKGGYAYLIESVMNEYVTQRNCDLMQVGGLLDSKGYGIGTPRCKCWQKGVRLGLYRLLLYLQAGENDNFFFHVFVDSKYRDLISDAILKLQETQMLHELHDRWWKRAPGAGQCDHDDKGKKNANALAIANVGGIFVVLVTGLGLALIVAVLEFVWQVHKNAKQEMVSK